MEETKLKRKKPKKKSKLSKAMNDPKMRYLIMLGLMLPFIVAIAIFGNTAYKEYKNLKDLAAGTQTETKAENLISSMNYILRDNPTDLQKEYFAKLKSAVEDGVVDEVPADDKTIAELVAENYVIDFYTWTNKRGQYDIGGMIFVYDGEYENGDHYKENVYQAARDGFYKYVSAYGSEYGKENLLEVESVEVTRSEKLSSPYYINEHIANRKDADGEWYDYREDVPYDGYSISVRWTYKENNSLNVNNFANSINLAVINRDGRFEIVEASENTINGRTGSKENTQTEETDEITDVETGD